MKLLTQEEGARLRPGDKVNVVWFSPRKPKGEEPFSREWDGRQEWVETVWRNEVVDTLPWESTQDGLVVKLGGRMGVYCVNRMETV